jgi:predicted secreted protein
MTIVQIIVAYAVCWWLVLFMVLPFGVKPVAKPAPGHAPSAPEKPRLRRKFGITTLFAILPTLAIYLVASAAKAEEGMYQTKGDDCLTHLEHQADADIRARDGFDASGQPITPATLPSEALFEGDASVSIPIEIPLADYRAEDGRTELLRKTMVNPGKIDVPLDGNSPIRFNDKPLTSTARASGCAPKEAP